MNLEQAIGNQLNYYKRQRNIIKAHHTKASLISLRKDWLDRQKASSYQNEYDRIRGILQNSSLPGVTKESLNKRVKELKQMDVTDKYDTMPLF
jgi:septation ring formation regulator EzrA